MLLPILVGVVAATVFYIRYLYSFWERKGFPYDKPSIPFGCLEPVVKRQRSFGMAIHDVYERSKEKFVGIYLMYRPALLIRDAELARNMMVQDFASFHDRGIYVDEEKNPFSGNLFSLEGERWRTLRSKLTPSFSSGKLKAMFGTIDDVGSRMVDFLNEQVPENKVSVIETKEVFSKYATDIVGSVIFGLDVDSFKNPENEFRSIGMKFIKPTFLSVLKSTAFFLCPPLDKLFAKLGIEEESANIMKGIVRETVEFRENTNYSRKDLMQLLIQLRNTGKINLDDTIWNTESVAEGFKSMSIESLAGHAFLFYGAGLETTASSASFTLYEISQNPEILAKVLADIKQALDKHDGKITYESIQDMKYLELCVMETVRKYPGLPILNRQCTKDFPIPGTDKVIEKGTPIIIPLFGIQRDEENFPDPMKYDPERYLESNMNYNPTAYMPFGEGPRHCIAQRLGKINVKVGLAKVLINYDIEPYEKKELEIDTYASLIAKGGANVRLRRKVKAF